MAMNTVDVASAKVSEVPSIVDCPSVKHEMQLPEECGSGEAALYNKLSKAGAIAGSKAFKIVGLTMTVFLLIWQGIDADYNDAAVLSEAEPIFQAVHMIFFLFFGTEALVRFSAVRDKRQIRKYRDLIKDIILVVFLVVRVAVTSISSPAIRIILLVTFMAQFARDGRLFRMKDLFKRPEHADTSSLMVESAKDVLRCFFIILFIHYMVAVAMLKINQDTELGEEHFPNVLQGMQSLQDVEDTPGVLLAEFVGFFIMYLVNFVKCCVVVILTVRNVVLRIRMSQKAGTQSASTASSNENKEIAERV
eukprot:gnl/MRDRNA2_/MRDRNA2_45234_c0_seq1.p1 gnl/MRDRNA2_/MRDRNA2_45234_c0~~gnl/MRDRNA2_/MRDRNA2_45234_c0_seq1.p1  ORF type:complete len:335 (-),score=62.85 gnl/MRDRNA2_/MRDRNA2_45234_c0_seq1:242-1159(-)